MSFFINEDFRILSKFYLSNSINLLKTWFAHKQSGKYKLAQFIEWWNIKMPQVQDKYEL